MLPKKVSKLILRGSLIWFKIFIDKNVPIQKHVKLIVEIFSIIRYNQDKIKQDVLLLLTYVILLISS